MMMIQSWALAELGAVFGTAVLNTLAFFCGMLKPFEWFFKAF